MASTAKAAERILFEFLVLICGHRLAALKTHIEFGIERSASTERPLPGDACSFWGTLGAPLGDFGAPFGTLWARLGGAFGIPLGAPFGFR